MRKWMKGVSPPSQCRLSRTASSWNPDPISNKQARTVWRVLIRSIYREKWSRWMKSGALIEAGRPRQLKRQNRAIFKKKHPPSSWLAPLPSLFFTFRQLQIQLRQLVSNLLWQGGQINAAVCHGFDDKLKNSLVEKNLDCCLDVIKM